MIFFATSCFHSVGTKLDILSKKDDLAQSSFLSLIYVQNLGLIPVDVIPCHGEEGWILACFLSKFFKYKVPQRDPGWSWIVISENHKKYVVS